MSITEYNSIEEYEDHINKVLEEDSYEENPTAYNLDHDQTWFHQRKLSHVYSIELVESGHDWISPVTRQEDGSIREEFKPSTVDITDRLDSQEYEFGPAEAVCNWCHLTYLAKRKSCPDCDMVDSVH